MPSVATSRRGDAPTTRLKAYWNAFLAGGSDETDGTESNTEGNHLGSYNMALQWQAPKFTARAYFERFFEDQSMLTLQYGIYDHLLGAEVAFRDFKPIRHIVVEHISTTDQSGAVYHDQTASMPEKMNGRDNYYNHHLYNGWMHWGRAIGNPLITSPVYSSTRRYTLDGDLRFRNNRIRAWHIGVDGQISAEWSYLARLSITQNRGIYDLPFDEFAYQTYAQLGSVYQPRWQPDLTSLNLGYDTGGCWPQFGAQARNFQTFSPMKAASNPSEPHAPAWTAVWHFGLSAMLLAVSAATSCR